MSRRALAVLTAVAFALGARTASADERPARVRLEWTAEGGCLETEKLRPQIEDALGRAAFTDEGGADLVLVGHAGPTPTGFEAVVTLSRSTGEVLGTRTLASRATRCDELSMGLPLALALMIDLPLREATVRVTLPVPPPPLVKETPRPPPPPPPPPSSLHAAFLAGPVLRVGWLPSVAIGARVAAEISIGPVPLGIEATWVAPSSQDDGRVAAQTWSLSAAIYGCPLTATTRRFYADGCAYVEGGAALSYGVRASAPRTDEAWLLVTGARMRGGLKWSPWTLGLELGAGAFLVRPGVAYDVAGGGRATLAEAWPISLDVFLCAGVWLP